jgi:hypothetical protein
MKTRDWNGYQRDWRAANSEAASAASRRWRESHPEVYTASHRNGVKRWIQANKEAATAHQLVFRAIRRGDLIRQPCQECGNPKGQAHHDDYSKPLEVIWLCAHHHRQQHKT